MNIQLFRLLCCREFRRSLVFPTNCDLWFVYTGILRVFCVKTEIYVADTNVINATLPIVDYLTY